MRPVPHSEDLPVPHPLTHLIVGDESEHEAHTEVQSDEKDDPTLEENTSSCEHLLTQGDLNDLLRDLKLSKKQAELLGSRLKGWNLLQNGTKVCFFRNRQDGFQDLYSGENCLVYCNNI
jgi:hypothetical protein